MDREEKVKGEERKKGEITGQKWKRGILMGKREGNSTPTTTWKFGIIQPDGTPIQDSLSARKLGASLWEMETQFNPRVDKVNKKLSHQKQDSNTIDAQDQTPPEQMAPSRPVFSPNGSVGSSGKLGESSHGLKTSTELLKVLNRIWNLEEKNALDTSLMKTLRADLGQSQAQIQELLQEKKRDQIEIDRLTEQITESRVVRKKDQDRIRGAVKLLEEDLENESKLRRRSEKRHRKLAEELSEMKSYFSDALTEVEREKKARNLLEDLCDEFAKGIRDYERQVRLMKQKSNEGRQITREGNDRFILHISEAWLDERTQMKLADTRNTSEKPSPLDKLCSEIETYLRLKNNYTPVKKSCESVRSLETLRLNEHASAPWNVNEEDDSVGIISSRSLMQANPIGTRQRHFGNLASNNRFKETENSRTPRKGDVIQSTSDANVALQNSSIGKSSFNFLDGSFDRSVFTGPSSPVKKWVSKVSAADPEISGSSSSSSRWVKSIESNTLKARLIEARLEGKHSRARASTSSSKAD